MVSLREALYGEDGSWMRMKRNLWVTPLKKRDMQDLTSFQDFSDLSNQLTEIGSQRYSTKASRRRIVTL